MSRNLHDRLMYVQHVIDETPETKSFSLRLSNEPLPFIPGQFVNVTANAEGQRVRRAYSIASSPLDAELLLTVKKMEDGLLSKFLCDRIQPGDILHIRGPYGRFTLEDNRRPLVLIAAGSGIVPFRSMWRYIRQTGAKTIFSVLYASKALRYVIYRNELEELTQAGYRVAHALTRNDDPRWTGYSRRIDREMLVDFVDDFSRTLFYVCGPPDFCDCVGGYLLNLGVEQKSIKTEKYD